MAYSNVVYTIYVFIDNKQINAKSFRQVKKTGTMTLCNNEEAKKIAQ